MSNERWYWGAALLLILMKSWNGVKQCEMVRRLLESDTYTAQWSKLRIWLHLLKKSLMENFIFCAVRLPSITRAKYNIYI